MDFVTIKGVKVRDMSEYTPKDNPDKTYYTIREDRGLASPKWSLTEKAYYQAKSFDVCIGAEVDIDVELAWLGKDEKFGLGKVIEIRKPEKGGKNE